MSNSRLPFSTAPGRQGLYNPDYEHDACGLALVVRYRGQADHLVVQQALTALRNMEHRGGVGGDEGTGDGAGITVNIPDSFLREHVDFGLPANGKYAVGTAFFDPESVAEQKALVENLAHEEGLRVLGWRTVPVEPETVGPTARKVMPHFEHLFVELVDSDHDDDSVTNSAGTHSFLRTPGLLERRAFALRKRCERAGVYFPSLSAATLTYKGMVTTAQLGRFYPDLADAHFVSRIAMVHSRFSTNTFPSWQLAQPFRFVAHNGEINTVRANRNWMRARESELSSTRLASPLSDGSNRDLSRLFPITTLGMSDSASFDEVLELLVMGGRSLPHAVAMMIPETWENDPHMSEQRRAFYAYHSHLMEPWDGPAFVGFTDGVLAGGVLDRNGLRPARYVVTHNTVVMASEVGVVDLDPATIIKRGRLKPGRMFLVDVQAGRIISDTEVKTALATQHPYAQWLENSVSLADLPGREHVRHPQASITRRQQTFGYSEEDLRIVIEPMAQSGAEPLGAMGSDTPIAAIAQRPRVLFDYFVQNFAQVTNPPLDAIREEIVTSMSTGIGVERNLLAPGAEHATQIRIPRPVIDNDELAKIVHVKSPTLGRARVFKGLYRPGNNGRNLARRIEELCTEVSAAVAEGITYLVLSDRNSGPDLAPIPSLLMVSAIHHHLIRERSRTKVALIVETGDAREVHHIATLIGFGASAVNPYLAMETAELLVRKKRVTGVSEEEAVVNLLTALNKGLLKIMSKMGISTVQSYHGAQTFEAVGLATEVIDKYFSGTTGRLGGLDVEGIAAEVEARHLLAYPSVHPENAHRSLPVGGEYQWRREGPAHLFNPETIALLQWSTRNNNYAQFKEFSSLIDNQAKELLTLRGLLDFVPSPNGPLPLDEVEPVEDIVTRFSTGAMSYGSLSQEAHETLAVAMNRLGAKSNTGEGGEDPQRLLDPARRSAIKQVASGRFGVTSMYLTHADDIQIKMAQGAKPGEGGQLPGTKVYPWIAQTRHATPGVGLISPPPHHDIYSIEDLAQLIYDLGHANTRARIHVKLVASSGVGTVAAGVAKAGADVVLISGHDGGTGASPLNSLKHAGEPWELGLAEAQQTLVLSGLRERVSLQVDGQLKTGRDVVIAALLGAEEFGFATAPLVVAGCVMMRVCHKDTCPVGVATQNPELRGRFTGDPDHVVNYFRFIAREVREILAELGYRSLDEAIGQVERLKAVATPDHWKARGIDVADILRVPTRVDGGVAKQRQRGLGQPAVRTDHFDSALIAAAAQTFDTRKPVEISAEVTNVDRSVGAMLGFEMSSRWGDEPRADDVVTVNLSGYAGQSLGAFIPRGITLNLFGDANDYVGKGLSGGIVTARPARGVSVGTVDSIIAGNVVGYGATSGKLFLAGQVGERFLVRNSGAQAVVEGCGDHGLEYMTGGTAVILGDVGRNFAAGMSGGTAYVFDFNPARLNKQDRQAGAFSISALNDTDTELVVQLLREHARRTDSTIANNLLEQLDIGEDVFGRFTKLVPQAYSRVKTIELKVANGEIPDDQLWSRILEVTRG